MTEEMSCLFCIKKKGKNRMKEFNSHYRETDKTYQKNGAHQNNTAKLAEEYCRIYYLKKIAYLTGLHHDDGKYIEKWQNYFKKIVEENGGKTGIKMDHSTLGGLVFHSYCTDALLSTMAEIAIYTHHGLTDCVSLKDGESLVGKRRRKYSKEQCLAVRKIFEQEQEMAEADTIELMGKASQDLKQLAARLKKLPYDENGQRVYGNADFYLGMCERELFSVLADADIRDTIDFKENQRTYTGMSDEEMHFAWEKGLENLERKLADLKKKDADSPLNPIREELSLKCEEAAYTHGNRYQLAAATGMGKTLSAFRFALRRACETGKRHIFYVAPFLNCLEQNADRIREVMGNNDWVLEHHGDVVFEKEEESWKYERLIENWDEVPVIATTAVQFFQTLFGKEKKNLRRFHSLCSSVIIFDEVQALPVKAMGLFNLAVNFLSEIADSTVLLCTATQPLLEEVAENRMKKTVNIQGLMSADTSLIHRVEYHDCTDGGGKSMGIKDASDFILEKVKQEKKILAVLNTRNAARRMYESLEGKVSGKLFHLSTFMCAEHRSDVLREIQEALNIEDEIICISTQLVEAGVDFSFPCVIRSMAGLDNLIQTAGRCNRNGDPSVGNAYIIQLDPEAECLFSLSDIRRSQNGLRKLLRIYQEKPEELDGSLDSEKAIQAYYREYLLGREAEEKYPVRVNGVATDLIELLSKNRKFAGHLRGVPLKQAFRTAGEQFSLIDKQKGTDVVVLYKDAEKILESLTKEEDPKCRKQKMRKLQKYTVNLPDYILSKWGTEAIHTREDGIRVLKKNYYCETTGVREPV